MNKEPSDEFWEVCADLELREVGLTLLRSWLEFKFLTFITFLGSRLDREVVELRLRLSDTSLMLSVM